MKKIVLINMPFADLKLPSLALTQLKAILDKELGERVSTQVLYLNHDFAHFLGLNAYQYFVNSMESLRSGLGEWFFSHSAFPNSADNRKEFFDRYYSQSNGRADKLKRFVDSRRDKLDAFLDSLVDQYALDEAPLVGFTSMFAQNVASLALARHIKNRSQETTVVMGGANCEHPMGGELVRNVPSVDYVFSGPGLISFPAFVRKWLADERDACETIPGVTTKNNCASTSHARYGEELPIEHGIPLDYDDFLSAVRTSFPADEVNPNLLFETSRGCWWGQRAHCTFCGLNGLSMSYRSMPAPQAVEQINGLFRYAAAEGTHFQAVDNIMPQRYPSDVFPHLKPPPSATLFYEVKADLTETDFDVLSRTRVKRVQPGIEALATSTLKLMKKGTNAFQNLSFLKHCLTYDVFPDWNLLMGLPGEGEEVFEHYKAVLPLLVHLPPPSGVHQIRFDRFSPYFVRSEEYGLELRPMGFYRLAYPFDDESLFNLAYYFGDANGEAPYRRAVTKWYDEIQEIVTSWRRRWHLKHDRVPLLYASERCGRPVVCDSRSGDTVHHELSPVEADTLNALSRPRRVNECEVPGAANGNVPAAVAGLSERGLLFEEKGRYFSLVLPSEPPLQSVRV